MHRDSLFRALHAPVPHGLLSARLTERHQALGESRLGELREVREDRKHIKRYLRSHEVVKRAGERVVAKLAQKGRSLDLELLAVDAAYQRLRARLRAEEDLAPNLSTLSGGHSLVSGMRALQAAVHLSDERGVAGDGCDREFLARAAKLLDVTRMREYQALARSHENRADALGRALRALRAVQGNRRHEVVLSGAADGGEPALSAQSDPSSGYGSSVVRILVHDEFAGTGFLVRPTVLLTAAHVIGQSTPSSAIRVQTANGEEVAVNGARVNADWARSQATDHDAAMVLVSEVDGAGIPILWDFAAAGGSYGVARYGYPADSSASYATGHVHRAATRFYTPDSALQIPAGESGCPLLYESHGVTFAVGVGTARSVPGDTNAFIGIPVLQSILPTFA